MQHALETVALYWLTYVLPYGSALIAMYRIAEAAFGPVVKQKAPRLAHALEALSAIVVDAIPFLKSVFAILTGKPWPTLGTPVAVVTPPNVSGK